MTRPQPAYVDQVLGRPVSETAPLAIVVAHERSQKGLSIDARRRIAKLSGPRPGRFLIEIAKIWMTIAVVTGVAVYSHNLFISAFAIVIIGGRQSALGLMMHEQAHYLGIKSRWGDIVTNVLVCYPLLFVNVMAYARIHLVHHRFFFSDKDPDLTRKSGHDWEFPMSRRRLAWLFLRNLAGLNLVQTIIGKNKNTNLPALKRLGRSHWWTHPLFLISWAMIFTLTHSWSLFLLYWLLPLMTTLQAFVLLGAICEHVYIKGATLEASTAIIMPTRLERLLFPDYNFFYHIYHHYHPTVSFANLPEVHGIYVSEGLLPEAPVFNSISKYLDSLTSFEKLQSA